MYFPRNGEWNLFDLKNDPHEMQSLHQDQTYQPVLTSLKQRYQDIKTFYDANSAVIPQTRGDEPWWRQWETKQRTISSRKGTSTLLSLVIPSLRDGKAMERPFGSNITATANPST